jgi:hypothetical protein
MVEMPLISVWKIIKINEKSQYPDKFEDFVYVYNPDDKIEFQKMNLDDLTRFDRRKQQRNKKHNNKRRNI